MKASEKEILWSILDDYYSEDDANLDIVAVAQRLVDTVSRMIKYKHKQ
jgi:hypothetical protein